MVFHANLCPIFIIIIRKMLMGEEEQEKSGRKVSFPRWQLLYFSTEKAPRENKWKTLVWEVNFKEKYGTY